jgi:hypothetical protein
MAARTSTKCGGPTVLALEDDLHKYRWETEKLLLSKQEAEKQMNDLANRVSVLQAERNRMKASLQVGRAGSSHRHLGPARVLEQQERQ